MAVEDGGDLLNFGLEFGEFGGEDGLHAVGEGFFGLVVDFDEEAVTADGYGGAVLGRSAEQPMASGRDGGPDRHCTSCCPGVEATSNSRRWPWPATYVVVNGWEPRGN